MTTTSETKQEPKVDKVTKYETSEQTDLTSFNAFCFVPLSDGQTPLVQVTGRHGISADELYADFKEFVAFMDKATTDHFVKFTTKRNDKNSDSTPAESNGEVKANGNKTSRKWDEPVPQAELPAELTDVTVDVFTQEFDVVKVLPQPDNKATVEFWKDNLKFAVGAKLNKAKYDVVNKYLSGLGVEPPIDPSKAGEYRFAGVQYWTQGAEYEYNGQTKHYKNIALLKPTL